MSDFTLTSEQDAILAEARSPASLKLVALAGAAKTTTLCLLAAKLPLVPTLCCAFNKKIADEMKRRMPGHIECSTMNSLGHRAWGKKLGRRLVLNTDKTYDILQAVKNTLRPEERTRFGEATSSLLRAARLAKSNGFIPPRFASMGKSLVEPELFIDSIAADMDVEPDAEFEAWLCEILERSIAEGFEGRIDFDDQIYLSVCFSAPFPKYEIILVDEAQDLSPMNHEMLRMMFGKRLIAVGDPYQAIYGFRGAHSSSMDVLSDEFEMKELTLNVSFRCPITVVERARSRAPHMAYPDWAQKGLVERVSKWGPNTIGDDAVVICRNNAPLLSGALKLLRAGRQVRLKGLERSLVANLKKLGSDSDSASVLLEALKEWEKDQLSKARESRKGPILDKAACMRAIIEETNTLAEAIAFAQHLFEGAAGVQFMTGHAAKGLEFDTVYHLESFLIPSKYALRAADEGDPTKLEQEKNLRYVIETRSKENLFLIDLEDYDAAL